jgi:hypothetical protein
MFNRASLRIVFALALSVTTICAAQSIPPAAADPAREADPLAGLKPTHPRLLMSGADWTALRERSRQDPELAGVVARIEADAKALLSEPPLVYRKEGRRLLDVSRQALQRVLLWSATYRLTGERVYADRAKRELLSLAAFPDWNPSHFLDTAEMTTAFAFGYDWLFDELDASSRDLIRRAIVEKGLQPGSDPKAGYNSWHRSANNWNQVCFGGLTLGALAIGDEEPVPARNFLKLARAGIAAGLRPYAPDGIYPEGPGYWGYGTVYQTLMLAALQSALGTQWQLDASPGFLPSATAQLQLTGPFGRPFNFFDSGDRTELQPAAFWFARQLHRPELLFFQRASLGEALDRAVETERAYHENRLFTLIALWWTALPNPNTSLKLPLAWHGDGPNPVGVFRTSWSDTNALFLAFKGGTANLSHGHMDAGSFVLDADGVRWAIDLGRQDYLSLESKGVDLWNSAQNSDRWRVFRLNNFSHNTLTIGNQLHRVGGAARITEFHDDANPRATLDLSPVFAGQAERVLRRFQLGADRTVTIRDELSGVAPGTEVRWAMVTRAQVKLNRNQVTLAQASRTLRAGLLSPADATFSVIPADPPNDGFNAPNPGTRILIVKVSAPASGRIQLEVTLHPESTDGFRSAPSDAPRGRN